MKTIATTVVLYSTPMYSLVFHTNIYFGMIIYNKKKIRVDHFAPMLFFVVPTIITSILAIVMYGTAISWVGTTLAIFIIYLSYKASVWALTTLQISITGANSMNTSKTRCVAGAQ